MSLIDRMELIEQVDEKLLREIINSQKENNKKKKVGVQIEKAKKSNYYYNT